MEEGILHLEARSDVVNGWCIEITSGEETGIAVDWQLYHDAHEKWEEKK